MGKASLGRGKSKIDEFAELQLAYMAMEKKEIPLD